MHIELVTEQQRLAEIGPQWNELLADSDSDNPFMQWEWCSTWWRYYGPGHKLAVVLVWDAAELIGLAPLYVAQDGRSHRGVMQFLATGEVCSEYMSFALRKSREREACAELLRFLLEDRAVSWRRLALNNVLQDTTPLRILQQGLSETNRAYCVRPSTRTWWVELPASWEQYAASVSKNRREKFKRMRREMVKRDLTYFAVEHENQIDAAWHELVRLHQARWTNQGEPGCFAWPRFASFHAAMLRPLWRRGMLLLTLLYEQDRAVAASYMLRHRGRVYSYQGGVDPTRMDYAPGRILLMCELAESIERGDRAYDFLGGDDEYKANWATHHAELAHITIAGRGLGPRLRMGMESAARWVKAAARARLSPRAWSSLQNWKRHLSSPLKNSS